jgi:hypothetical protein
MEQTTPSVGRGEALRARLRAVADREDFDRGTTDDEYREVHDDLPRRAVMKARALCKLCGNYRGPTAKASIEALCRTCAARKSGQVAKMNWVYRPESRAQKQQRAPSSSWWAGVDRATFNENLKREQPRLQLAGSKVEEVL